MIKHEAAFQAQFSKFLKWSKMTGYFELKYCKTDNMSYSAVEMHQINSLVNAGIGGLVWKLSDADPRTKPFDCISTPSMQSYPGMRPYVVIRFKSGIIGISIENFLAEKMSSKTKSLSYETAKQISSFKIRLKEKAV